IADAAVASTDEAVVAPPVDEPAIAGLAPEAPTAGPDPAGPVVPLVPPEPGRSPFPPLDPPLVLTPATEADFAQAGRTVWGPDQRAGAEPQPPETVLFEEQPTLSVLRHEIETTPPRRF